MYFNGTNSELMSMPKQKIEQKSMKKRIHYPQEFAMAE